MAKMYVLQSLCVQWERWPNVIHPTAVISDKASIGENVTIGPFCVIDDDVTIGDGCVLKSHVVKNYLL